MSETQSTEARLCAAMTLPAALEFATKNFEKQDERDFLMQMFSQAAESPDARIRMSSYKSLLVVGDMHCAHLQPHNAKIMRLTQKRVQSSDSETEMQTTVRSNLAHTNTESVSRSCWTHMACSKLDSIFTSARCTFVLGA